MNTKKTLGIVLCIPLLLWAAAFIYTGVIFDIEIGGHMKRAADSNTIELATTETNIVVTELERKGWTQGYTSIIYRTPDEDVGFWYTNLKSALTELESVPQNATQLEKSNVLMKLRETLTDSKQSGDTINTPPGIPRYPENRLYALWGLFGSFLLVVGIFLVVQGAEEERIQQTRRMFRRKTLEDD